MRFGVGLPTCTAGMMYPAPFASAQDVVGIAIEAEQLGFFEVAGNDHLSTQEYVRREWSVPPDFFDPLMILSHCAAHTSTLRLMTGILVVPMRHPVVLAKQVATLDQLSRGRVILGVGIGAYREEFTACYPERAGVARSELLNEGVALMRRLWTERTVTFAGRHVTVSDVEMFPKPVQDPLPVYFAGNALGSIRRAAEHGQGWMPAGIGPDAVGSGRRRLDALALAAQRRPGDIVTAPQVVVSLGATHAEAVATFESSQLFKHLVSLKDSTLRNADMSRLTEGNLVGTPDEVCSRIAEYASAGATHLSGLLFVGNTVEELMRGMRWFSRDVIPGFAEV